VEDFGPDNMEGELVPVWSISHVPITNFIGTFDRICPVGTQKEYLDSTDTEITYHWFHGKGHGHFASHNSESYMDLIECELQIPGTRGRKCRGGNRN
jgi:surfactin synthase thioesterase subunit